METLDYNLLKLVKQAFLAMPAGQPMPKEGQPVDPAMMGMPPGGAPMDPAAAGGMPPMDPAMAGAPPMDPAAAGGAPIDPAMLQAMMQDPAMAGGAPSSDPLAGLPPPEVAESKIVLKPSELVEIIRAIKGGKGPGADGKVQDGKSPANPAITGALNA